MFEKIIRVTFLFTIGAMGLVMFVTGLAESIVQFRWWSFLVVPVLFIVFEIGFIVALIFSDWVVYAIKNRTFRGFLQTVSSNITGENLARLEMENGQLKEQAKLMKDTLEFVRTTLIFEKYHTVLPQEVWEKNEKALLFIDEAIGGNQDAENNKCLKNS